MTIDRLPPEFWQAIVEAALKYTAVRGQPGAPAHYKNLRMACHWAREYLALPEEAPAERIEAELLATVEKWTRRAA